MFTGISLHLAQGGVVSVLEALARVRCTHSKRNSAAFSPAKRNCYFASSTAIKAFLPVPVEEATSPNRRSNWVQWEGTRVSAEPGNTCCRTMYLPRAYKHSPTTTGSALDDSTATNAVNARDKAVGSTSS